MSTKIKETIPCGCCGHEIPRPPFFKRSRHTITCPICKTQGWIRRLSKRSYILQLILALVPPILTISILSLLDLHGGLPFLICYLIIGLPLLCLYLYYYEAEYMWPKDVSQK